MEHVLKKIILLAALLNGAELCAMHNASSNYGLFFPTLDDIVITVIITQPCNAHLFRSPHALLKNEDGTYYKYQEGKLIRSPYASTQYTKIIECKIVRGIPENCKQQFDDHQEIRARW